MKKIYSILAIVFGLSFSLPGLASSASREIQMDILVLDAITELARTGAAGAFYAAKESRPGYDPSLYPRNDHTNFVENVERAADISSIAVCPTCSVLDWASKSYIPWWGRFMPFSKGDDGYYLARKAAISVFQSPNPTTWGPDLLWAATTEEAWLAIRSCSSEEDIGGRAAYLSWRIVLEKRNEIEQAIRNNLKSNYLSNKFDAEKILNAFNETINKDYFENALDIAKDFYKNEVAKIEEKMIRYKLISEYRLRNYVTGMPYISPT